MNRPAKLGDTVYVIKPKPFKLSGNIFDGFMGWDDWGPIFVHHLEDRVETILDTPEKVDEWNRR